MWASMMGFTFLDETVGEAGVVGGTAFLSALVLAVTAEPVPNIREPTKTSTRAFALDPVP
jgi:hypothetical protein